MFIDIPSNIINLTVQNDPAILKVIMHSYLSAGVNILMALRLGHTDAPSFFSLQIRFHDGVSNIRRYLLFDYLLTDQRFFPNYVSLHLYHFWSQCLQLSHGIRVAILLTQLRQRLIFLLVDLEGFIGVVIVVTLNYYVLFVYFWHIQILRLLLVNSKFYFPTIFLLVCRQRLKRIIYGL